MAAKNHTLKATKNRKKESSPKPNSETDQTEWNALIL